MTDKALTTVTPAQVLEKVVVGGDLSQLSSGERLSYYRATCESLGLNPLTRPFEYITLNDKLTLYARRDATDQLRNRDGINITIVAREVVEGVYIVTAKATTKDGRTDESIGAVPLVKEGGEWKTNQNGKRYFAKDGTVMPLSPDERANAVMKAETKAKRRVTLSIVGLGMLDETELETIPTARQPEPTIEQATPPKAQPAKPNGKPEPQAAPPTVNADEWATWDNLIDRARASDLAIWDSIKVSLERRGIVFDKDLRPQVDPHQRDKLTASLGQTVNKARSRQAELAAAWPGLRERAMRLDIGTEPLPIHGSLGEMQRIFETLDEQVSRAENERFQSETGQPADEQEGLPL